ncbi:DUF1697 domain-containing protein [Brachybacterium saurashtrense]|uniref:DUF1697 domain-containing protein n=1 Tax=Brachybacterium saurashtrense TaxID=556288 RepID=A0A345YP50_9MICO|nr:DUF1697 domain-containing protein [Brachybacterium saurashtrense]AXK45702.1 DUF1697 domain-containing protein [Brachybacterium saurashtrense]RRR24720.1 DUF1697 domain-containing protein [Brachybacterium saurashtrense]
MTRWVALLRGVNVGGITVRSAPLAELFRELGFTQVVTVLATGNVVFDAAEDAATMKPLIESALTERFGYEAWIVLVTQAEIARRAEEFPFAEDEATQPYLLFGSDEAVLDELFAAARALESAVERIARGPGLLYWSLPTGRSTNSPVAKLVARARYRSTTTNRSLRTVRRIAAA